MRKNSIKNQIKKINIMFSVVFLFVTFLALVISYMVMKWGALAETSENTTMIIKVLCILIFLGGVPLNIKVSNNQLKRIKNDYPLDKKITKYWEMFMLRMAMYEGISLLSIISYALTADKSMILLFVILLIFMIMSAPTKRKIINELQLNNEEIDQLYNEIS